MHMRSRVLVANSTHAYNQFAGSYTVCMFILAQLTCEHGLAFFESVRTEDHVHPLLEHTLVP
jgi:hypothetical protein